MEITGYTEESAFDALQVEWNPLLQRAPVNHVFYTWEWQRTWWEAYSPGELRVLTCRHDEQLVGIAPLFETESDAVRTLQIIGCVDVTDYLDFIVDQDHLTAAYTAFADYLAASRDEFDVLDFCNIPFDSPTRQILPGIVKRARLQHRC